MTSCFILSPLGVAADSLPGGTHYVTDKVRIAPLSDTHNLQIIKYLDGQGDEDKLSRRVRTRPAFVIPYNEIPYLKSISDDNERAIVTLQMHRFSLEYFASISVPMAVFSFDGEKVTSHCLDQVDMRFKEGQEHELKSKDWEKHNAYLRFMYRSVGRAPAADVVIRRICRAFREGPTADGIIDLAIGLECLVDAKIEIKFQFSLFHALINSGDLEQRSTTFKLLQELYDVRSTTVHGSTR